MMFTRFERWLLGLAAMAGVNAVAVAVAAAAILLGGSVR